jgi:hypothetical protein
MASIIASFCSLVRGALSVLTTTWRTAVVGPIRIIGMNLIRTFPSYQVAYSVTALSGNGAPPFPFRSAGCTDSASSHLTSYHMMALAQKSGLQGPKIRLYRCKAGSGTFGRPSRNRNFRSGPFSRLNRSRCGDSGEFVHCNLDFFISHVGNRAQLF